MWKMTRKLNILTAHSALMNNNNNNNNTSICKAHNVSIRAESEAPGMGMIALNETMLDHNRYENCISIILISFLT